MLATPILYDFYNYDPDHKEFAQLFVKFTQVSYQKTCVRSSMLDLLLFNKILFSSISNYCKLFKQSLSSIGALLLFIGMKNSMPRRQLKKKAPKAKTV